MTLLTCLLEIHYLAVDLKACFNSFLGLKDICQCHNLDLGRHELKKSEWAKWMGDKCWFINKYQSRSYFMGLTHTILPTHNTIKKMNLREEFSCQNEIWYCRIFYGWIVDTCVFSRVKTFFLWIYLIQMNITMSITRALNIAFDYAVFYTV